MKQFSIFLLLWVLTMPAIAEMAGVVTLSGYLKNKANGEALIGATVYIPELKTGVITNPYGFYSISVAPGNYSVSFSFIGYQTQSPSINLTTSQQFNLMLEEETKQIDEVVVTGEKKNRNVENLQMSMEKVQVKMIKKLPSFMGEIDIIKSITLLPGIQNGGEGSSGLYVRGGGPDENLMILDEAPVYNASHLLGFFSVFNSDAINDVQVYKGGIPAEYGGKASSVIDIRMKDGNSQKLGMSGGIGNISSRLTVEAPIIKDKWSFIVSGRRTYADYLGRMVGLEALKENQLYFYDLNLKTNAQINAKNRLYLSAYTGDDYFKVGESIYMKWGNLTSTVRWNHLFTDKLFSNTSLIFSRYNYNLGVPGSGADQFDWTSQIRDYNFKQDFSWYLNSKNKLTLGLNIIYHHFEPGQVDANEKSYFTDLKLANYNALDNSVYLSNEQSIGSRLTMRYGLRYSYFQQIGKGKVREYLHPDKPNEKEVIGTIEYGSGKLVPPAYHNLEPRLALKYMLSPESSIKASYNRMVQNLHLISNTNSPTPLDIWLPSSTYIKPLIANQVGLGYFRNFNKNMFETSAEVYYKKMKNVIDYVDGAELFLKENLETELLHGSGYAYGLELYAKKQEGRLTGWVSYTLARSMRKIPGINEGKAYPSSYDRTHNVSLVTNYDLSKRWNFSASWIFATGNPTSYPIAKYDVQGNTIYYYAARNSNRIPDYHRLDVSFTYDFKKNEHRKVKQTLNFSIYNLYARRNAYSVTFRQNEDNPNVSEATRLSIIGSMIPSVTYNFNF
ncbi:TonB-dependent receptor, plug precursor [Aquipluma nitroreducens]|uniref:TonB-dependent receptor, plug n=1 Tax=Aquipluma nitroreducens TaxID=2010828 RepID=A0A5K7S9M2_9BACT|nr:TonB-dependent receptor [Aquipluma nitroreducens]BBE18281.1 TonB-dependent receptor, plug precursor [Aquipluma nitroreducens]